MTPIHRIARARVQDDGTIVLPAVVARELRAAPGDELDVNLDELGRFEFEPVGRRPLEESDEDRWAALERVRAAWGNALGGQDPTEWVRALRDEWPD